jgi:hypothetical protein
MTWQTAAVASRQGFYQFFGDDKTARVSRNEQERQSGMIGQDLHPTACLLAINRRDVYMGSGAGEANGPFGKGKDGI